MMNVLTLEGEVASEADFKGEEEEE